MRVYAFIFPSFSSFFLVCLKLILKKNKEKDFFFTLIGFGVLYVMHKIFWFVCEHDREKKNSIKKKKQERKMQLILWLRKVIIY